MIRRLNSVVRHLYLLRLRPFGGRNSPNTVVAPCVPPESPLRGTMSGHGDGDGDGDGDGCRPSRAPGCRGEARPAHTVFAIRLLRTRCHGGEVCQAQQDHMHLRDRRSTMPEFCSLSHPELLPAHSPAALPVRFSRSQCGTV